MKLKISKIPLKILLLVIQIILKEMMLVYQLFQWGAKIIEKHFTLNKNFSNFRDHKLSCDPRQMRELVKKIRLIEKLLGDDKIKISPCEKESLLSSRRSVGITRDLKKGNIITKNDLIMIRPGAGYKDKKMLLVRN